MQISQSRAPTPTSFFLYSSHTPGLSSSSLITPGQALNARESPYIPEPVVITHTSQFYTYFPASSIPFCGSHVFPTFSPCSLCLLPVPMCISSCGSEWYGVSAYFSRDPVVFSIPIVSLSVGLTIHE